MKISLSGIKRKIHFIRLVFILQKKSVLYLETIILKKKSPSSNCGGLGNKPILREGCANCFETIKYCLVGKACALRLFLFYNKLLLYCTTWGGLGATEGRKGSLPEEDGYTLYLQRRKRKNRNRKRRHNQRL